MMPLRSFLCMLFSLCLPTTLLAHIQVEHPIVFATQAGEPSAVFMDLHNHSQEPVQLAFVQSKVKSRLALHGMQKGHMIDLPTILIPPQRTVQLKRGGLHIMVFDLEQSLQVGEQYPLSLFFDNGEVIEIKANVVAP
ncbi:copper chaperone PCu(A)C [Bisgaard Taxon 45]